MGKKNLNPADAYRKAQRKRELKKDTTGKFHPASYTQCLTPSTDLETAIKELEESRSDPVKLAELKGELEKINRKKAEYVEEHPEQRRLVYRRRREGEPEPELPVLKKRNLFKKNGLPRHPERSIYYDPVMNPFGVAPPGMPYVERPLRPDEIDSDAEMEDEDGIPLPPGLPPGTEEVHSDDDISMPEGPPPGREMEEGKLLNTFIVIAISAYAPESSFTTSFLRNTSAFRVSSKCCNKFFHPTSTTSTTRISSLKPRSSGTPSTASSDCRLSPAWHTYVISTTSSRSSLAHFTTTCTARMEQSSSASTPGFASFPSSSFPPFPPNAFPPPPPKFLPRQQSLSAMQDPLSSVPHQTFQAHRATQLAPRPATLPQIPSTNGSSTLPVNPSLPAKPTAAAEMAAATVFSAPQLRDFKKEATAFVPTAVKRKKAPTASSKVDAAPSFTSAAPSVEGGDDVEVGPARPDLVSALKTQFGPVPTKPASAKKEPAPKSDYDKFVEEMGDILGTK
ncbi:hypothetical protein BDZ97DRAFT_1775475 [Flammula alnicola]|nr:hypothetical protein BDZ97DRAFT_1775475 [Flammula alnicola]